MDDKLSRRAMLQNGAALGALALFGAAACSKKEAALACTDTTGVAASDLTMRTTMEYVERSAEPGKSCAGCLQFVAGAPNGCGTCKVLKGSINPNGYCKLYVAKPA